MDLMLKVIHECPDETLCKYPFVILMLSYLFRFEGKYEAAGKLTRLIDYILDNNPNGLSEDELRQLKGEYLLFLSFTRYNDIKKVYEGQTAAYKQLGGPSRYKLNEIPFTMGATSILSMFWCEPGRLDETLRDMQCFLPQHIKLTRGQGVGADSALHAEMMLMRGDDIQAEILCHKAMYQARSKKEICTCLCAEQILARLAILRGDVEGFFTALENIKSYAKESSNLYILRMVDISLSVVSVALDTTDMVANWFSDVESISKKVYARAVPYVNILYSHLLVREKRHAELLGLFDDAIGMAKEMNYIFPQIYSFLFKSRVYYARGREREALDNLLEAFALALPDRLYLPFAQHAYMDDLLSKAHRSSIAKWNEDIEQIRELYHRYQKGKTTILNALRQSESPLTPREREVALLAKERLSHQEIADKLFISKATVRTILYNAYNKLGIHSKSELYRINF